MTWNDEERRLLRAGKTLEPAVDASRDRLLLAIASSTAVALAAASVKAAITLETKLALVTLGQVGLASLAKGTIVGGAVGIAISASGDLVHLATNDGTPAPPAEHVTDVAAAPAEEPQTPPAPRAEQPVRSDPAAATSAPHRATATMAPSHTGPADDAPPSPPRRTAADRGLAALDAAKSALDRRDVTAAQQALATYDQHRGDGALDPEAALLRLQTLAASGQGNAAAALAEQWLSERPDTPYAARLRRIITSRSRSTP